MAVDSVNLMSTRAATADAVNAIRALEKELTAPRPAPGMCNVTLTGDAAKPVDKPAPPPPPPAGARARAGGLPSQFLLAARAQPRERKERPEHRQRGVRSDRHFQNHAMPPSIFLRGHHQPV